jgi:hypothetical protein
MVKKNSDNSMSEEIMLCTKRTVCARIIIRINLLYSTVSRWLLLNFIPMEQTGSLTPEFYEVLGIEDYPTKKQYGRERGTGKSTPYFICYNNY